MDMNIFKYEALKKHVGTYRKEGNFFIKLLQQHKFNITENKK